MGAISPIISLAFIRLRTNYGQNAGIASEISPRVCRVFSLCRSQRIGHIFFMCEVLKILMCEQALTDCIGWIQILVAKTRRSGYAQLRCNPPSPYQRLITSTSVALVSDLQAMKVRAPIPAKALAVSNPIPAFPPVTTATLPVRSASACGTATWPPILDIHSALSRTTVVVPI